MRSIKTAVLLGSMAIVSACAGGNQVWPASLFASDFPPPGPPNYQQGMNDGCRTALAAVGSGPYGTFVHAGFHQDVDKAMNDPVYYKAWKDGYFYCKYDHDKAPE